MASFKVICAALACLLVADLAWAQDDTVNANAFCMSCKGRRSSRDNYAHPTDCHQYYQCFFFNETSAVGHLRQCPPGTFFSAYYQSCILEGPTPCLDVCEASKNTPCAAVPGSCNQYIFCSASNNVMCCPTNTRIDVNTCECVLDETCTQPCSLMAPAVPTSVAPATSNATHCTDSFGNVLTPVPGQPDYYGLVDETGVYARPCAPGTQFLLSECRCGEPVELTNPQPSQNQCILYLPFDTDTADHSAMKLTTEAVGGADYTTSAAARGSGSLSTVNGGHIEVPATKTLDLQNKASFCAFVQCPASGCPTGGILSNNNNEQATSYNVILATMANNVVSAFLKFHYPFSEGDISGTFLAPGPVNGFNQICVVVEPVGIGAGNIALYINNQFVARKPVTSAWLFTPSCPIAIGSDQKYGDFAGYIDEVLVCPFSFGAQEVNAHYQGQAALRQLGLIP